MGTFLSLSVAIDKPIAEVQNALKLFAGLNGGDLTPSQDPDSPNALIIAGNNRHVCVQYPDGFLHWDAAAQFLSQRLNTAVFSFHIHDGDFWMYILYVNGEIADQFNPIPDYWDDELSPIELKAWRGNAAIVSKFTKIDASRFKNFLVRWKEDDDEARAYPDDEFGQEDWQLLDFLRRLNFPFPSDTDKASTRENFLLSLSDLPLDDEQERPVDNLKMEGKAWWKFW